MSLFGSVASAVMNPVGTMNNALYSQMPGSTRWAIPGYAEQQNYDLQQQQFEYQKQLQQTMFEREDNAVTRRVADLQKAGLSPTLAAGSAAGSGPVVNTSAPQRERTPLLEAAQMVLGAMRQGVDISRTQAETDNIIAQTDKTRINTVTDTVLAKTALERINAGLNLTRGHTNLSYAQAALASATAGLNTQRSLTEQYERALAEQSGTSTHPGQGGDIVRTIMGGIMLPFRRSEQINRAGQRR